MRNVGKFLIGSALAVTMAVSGSAASARPWGYGGYGGGYYRHYHRYHGDGFGNFLLGAGVVGLIAAVASSGSRDDDRAIHTVRDDPPPAPVYEEDYPPPPPPPPVRPQAQYDNGSRYERDAAVDACKVAAEREGEKYSSRVRVDTIEDVRSQREGGYRVTGVVAIDKGGYNGGNRANLEHSRFDCTSAGGRVVAFRLGSSAEMAQRY